MTKNDLIELVFENAEVVVDQLHDNDLLKDIPLIGNIFKVLSLLQTTRDRLFLTKLSKFLFSLNEVSEKEREKIKKKMTDNPDEAKDIASKIILVIDKITDLEKSEIIANTFLSYINSKLNCDEFKRIVDGLDKAYIGDINQLISLSKLDIRVKESFLINLVGTNFVKFSGTDKVGEVGDMYYELSHLGAKLIEAFNFGKNLRERKKGE